MRKLIPLLAATILILGTQATSAAPVPAENQSTELASISTSKTTYAASESIAASVPAPSGTFYFCEWQVQGGWFDAMAYDPIGGSSCSWTFRLPGQPLPDSTSTVEVAFVGYYVNSDGDDSAIIHLLNLNIQPGAATPSSNKPAVMVSQSANYGLSGTTITLTPHLFNLPGYTGCRWHDGRIREGAPGTFTSTSLSTSCGAISRTFTGSFANHMGWLIRETSFSVSVNELVHRQNYLGGTARFAIVPVMP